MVTKDSLNRVILSEMDCIDLMLQGKSPNLANVDDAAKVAEYNERNDETFGYDDVLRTTDKNISEEEFHRDNTRTWFIPDKYKNIDVLQYALSKTSKPEEVDRVNMEFAMYEDRNLEDILRCMIYLIDYFKENDIVWGVGRGSSVASYILYLLGVHKIDSLLYKLDITEFLK